MSDFPARAAILNVIGKHRRRKATGAARSSIGGSPKRRFTRLRHYPENRCGLATCRPPVQRSSMRQQDKRISFGVLLKEAVRSGVLPLQPSSFLLTMRDAILTTAPSHAIREYSVLSVRRSWAHFMRKFAMAASMTAGGIYLDFAASGQVVIAFVLTVGGLALIALVHDQ